MRTLDRIKVLNDRLGALIDSKVAHVTLWPSGTEANTSAILVDTHAEWCVHYYATLQTLLKAVQEILIWYARPLKALSASNAALEQELRDMGAHIPLSMMEHGEEAFSATGVGVYQKLLDTIVVSAAKLAGVEAFTALVDLLEAFKDLKSTIKIAAEATVAAARFLARLESSMRKMLLYALSVESATGSLTGRFTNYAPVDEALINAWKAPIVARIEAKRAVFRKEGAYMLIEFPRQGMWPK